MHQSDAWRITGTQAQCTGELQRSCCCTKCEVGKQSSVGTSAWKNKCLQCGINEAVMPLRSVIVSVEAQRSADRNARAFSKLCRLDTQHGTRRMPTVGGMVVRSSCVTANPGFKL